MTKLFPGDIILYTVTPQSPLDSKLVAIGELLFNAGKKDILYSHVGIVANIVFNVEDLRDYEAKWPKSGQFMVDIHRPFEVWRINGITLKQRDGVVQWCRRHEGEWYNLIGLLTFGALGLKHTAVCSQYAGRAFASVGIKIPFEGKKLLSPDAIADYKFAHKVYTHVPKGKIK